MWRECGRQEGRGRGRGAAVHSAAVRGRLRRQGGRGGRPPSSGWTLGPSAQCYQPPVPHNITLVYSSASIFLSGTVAPVPRRGRVALRSVWPHGAGQGPHGGGKTSGKRRRLSRVRVIREAICSAPPPASHRPAAATVTVTARLAAAESGHDEMCLHNSFRERCNYASVPN